MRLGINLFEIPQSSKMPLMSMPTLWHKKALSKFDRAYKIYDYFLTNLSNSASKAGPLRFFATIMPFAFKR